MTGPVGTAAGAPPRARVDVASVVLDGEAVIHHRGRVHVLDPVATLVWQCCDGHATVDEIVVELAAVFSVPAETIGRDVHAAIEQLAELDLLADGSDAPDPGDGYELLADPPGACASCGERNWEWRQTYRVGTRLVAVGTNAENADRAIAASLAAHRVPTPPALAAEPPFFAVELHARGAGGGPQPLDLLHRGDTVAVRSRRPDEVLRALVGQLASYGDLHALGLAAVSGVVVAGGDRAVIVEPGVDSVRFRRELAHEGLLVADVPVALVDPASREVVVGAPGLDVDLAPIDALGAASNEAAPEAIPWGRYRVVGIGVAGPPSPAAALLALGPDVDDRRDQAGTIDALLGLLESVPVTNAIDPDAISALLARG